MKCLEIEHFGVYFHDIGFDRALFSIYIFSFFEGGCNKVLNVDLFLLSKFGKCSILTK